MPWERAPFFFFPRNLHVFSLPGPIYSLFPKDHLSYLLIVYLIYFGICSPFFSSLPQLERWLSTFILFMGSALFSDFNFQVQVSFIALMELGSVLISASRFLHPHIAKAVTPTVT